MFKRKWLGWMFAGLALMVLATGCSTLRGGPGKGGQGSAPLYYDGFHDILVPGELKTDKKNTSVIQAQGFAAGILSFYGRVEPRSLMGFFKENMLKDNWREIGTITASRSIMLFQKENRWCVINISEGDFNTYVEIGVVPKGAQSMNMPTVEPLSPVTQ